MMWHSLAGEPGDSTGYGADSAGVTEGMEIKGVADDVAQPADEPAEVDTYSEAATVILDSVPVAGGREEAEKR